MAEASGVATPRRELMVRVARAAGAVPAMLAVLDGTGTALPRGDATDLAILSAALTLEHHAIALYDEALRAHLLPAGLRAYGVEFRGDHLGHRDTQVALMEERGGNPPEPLAGYEIARLGAGDAVLRALLEIESAAERAYLALISQIRTRDYLLSAAFILVDEVGHQTVWRRALGLSIY